MAEFKGNPRSSGYDKVEHEWYVEPRACVLSILGAEDVGWNPWDPACGGGNIIDACAEMGITGVGTDIVDRANGRFKVANFLETNFCPSRYEPTAVITNPPFSLAEQFVRHALDIVSGPVLILQRLNFLESQKRLKLFTEHPLSRVWIHSKRQSMPPGGRDIEAKNGSMAYAWFVWRSRNKDLPQLCWLPD